MVLIFSALDGSTFVAGIDYTPLPLLFKRLFSLPVPESVHHFDVSRDLSGDYDASSLDEVLVAISASNFVVAIYMETNAKRNTTIFILPPGEGTISSCMLAGSWLHMLRQPSGHLLSVFFSITSEGKLICKPALFPNPPPRYIGPLFSTEHEIPSPRRPTFINLSRSSCDMIRAQKWRDVGIQHLIRMSDGHIGAVHKNGSGVTLRLADYCSTFEVKQQNGKRTAAEDFARLDAFNRHCQLHGVVTDLLLDDKIQTCLDVSIALKRGNTLCVKISEKQKNANDSLLPGVLGLSLNNVAPNDPATLQSISDSLSLLVEIRDCGRNDVHADGQADGRDMLILSSIAVHTEKWNARPVTRSFSEGCQKLYRRSLIPISDPFDKEIRVHLNLVPIIFPDQSSTGLPCPPIRSQLFSRQLDIFDWLQPCSQSPSPAFLSTSLRLHSKEAYAYVYALLISKDGPIDTTELALRHPLDGTAVCLSLQDLSEEGGSLGLTSSSCMMLWKLLTALRSRLSVFTVENPKNSFFSVNDLRTEYVLLKTMEAQLEECQSKDADAQKLLEVYTCLRNLKSSFL